MDTHSLDSSHKIFWIMHYLLRGWTEAKAGGDPVKVLGELSIDPVFVRPGAPVPPAGHPDQGVAQVRGGLGHQGATTVTLASVLSTCRKTYKELLFEY